MSRTQLLIIAGGFGIVVLYFFTKKQSAPALNTAAIIQSLNLGGDNGTGWTGGVGYVAPNPTETPDN